LRPTKKSAMHWVNFFHRKTAFLAGAEVMAKRLNQAVILPYIRRIKRGYYEVEFMLIEEFPYEKRDHSIIEKYSELLEVMITESPELWLWTHKRWKLSFEDLTV